MELTRRSVLERAAWTIAAATAVRPRPVAASHAAAPVGDDHGVIGKLSAYMSEAGDRDLPAEAAEKTKHHILDTLAAMVSGVELPPARVALTFARAHATERTAEKLATIAGTDIVCGAIDAALVNGMLAHSDETDDSHAPSHSHPGCAIVPAALAAGEQFGISGVRMLRAVTLGYDVGTRATMALGGFPFQMETHRSTHNIGGN